VKINRHDYRDGPSTYSVSLTADIESEGGQAFFGAENPTSTWRALVELSAAAQAAAQQLLSMSKAPELIESR
jgi:hypothetical protein